MIRQNPPQNKAVRPGGGEARRVAALCVGLAAITFAVFGQTAHHAFINCDDGTYVYQNPVVERGVTARGFVWAFSNHASNWHPLTWLSHEMDCQFYGSSAGGPHRMNAGLHAAAVIALFLVLRRMTGAFWRSGFVAAVFAIHPLRVESVAWIAERKDVLSGLFFMLTLWAYVRYVEEFKVQSSRFKVFRGLTLLFFALGLMCKPVLVTLPLVLLLLDFWPLRRTDSVWRLVREKMPLAVLSVLSCGVTLWAQAGAIQSSDLVSVPVRLSNAVASCMIYLRQMLWPAGLALFYPYPRNGPPLWETGVAGAMLVGVSVVVWRTRREQPWLLAGWAWYLVMLTPMAGIIQVGAQPHADRYTYLPQIGIYVALTWQAAAWASGRLPRGAQAALMAGVIAALSVCAWKQAGYWKDSETLWNRTLACTRKNVIAHLNLGNALLEKGKLKAAIVQYQDALYINPNYADAHFNLGIALLQKGDTQGAISNYMDAATLNPDSVDVRVNLGIALLKAGRVEEALSEDREALKINRDSTEARVNLGNALAQTGKLDDASREYEEALKRNPDDEVAQVNLGILLTQEGKAREALGHFQEGLQLNPADAKAKSNLAWVLATCGEASLRDGRKAVELARQADAQTGGENPMVLHSLAAALAEAGRFAEALATAQRALRLAAQSNPRLAAQLQIEMECYEAGRPFHVPGQAQ